VDVGLVHGGGALRGLTRVQAEAKTIVDAALGA
jgi:hypothetical protein